MQLLPFALAAALLAACEQPPPASTDDTLPAETGDDAADTDAFDTGWGVPVVDTDRGDDDDEPNRCAFGEVRDCNRTCFPEYFVGDGTCDDGSFSLADFDCENHAFDDGDCLSDTDPRPPQPPAAEGCPIFVRTFTGNWAVEVGWAIEKPNGVNVFSRQIGTLPTNNTTFTDAVTLEPGSYRFVKQDLLGDGWNSANYSISDFAGDEIASGTLITGFTGRDSFEVTCELDTAAPVVEAPACGDVDLTITTRTLAWQIGWALSTADGTLLAAAPSSTYTNNDVFVHPTSLPSGWYIFTLTDELGDGWNGASFVISDRASGETILDGTLDDGGRRDLPFLIDCSDTFEPGIPPIGDAVSCDPLAMRVEAGLRPTEVGWQIYDAGGRVVVDMQPGVYPTPGSYLTPVDLPTGAYTVRMLDAAGDGWQGASFELVDVATGFAFSRGGSSFTSGSQAEVFAGVACPAPLDTGLAPGECPAGATPDCGGVCWPEAYRGDGFCDDGTLYAPNFACPRLGMDDGDCAP